MLAGLIPILVEGLGFPLGLVIEEKGKQWHFHPFCLKFFPDLEQHGEFLIVKLGIRRVENQVVHTGIGQEHEVFVK